jgi:predicted CXXCH cytochrome family protein
MLVAVITMALADAPVLPEYLKTATYITSARCKMCHNKAPEASWTNWSATKHAVIAAALPWEANKDKPEKPTPEVAARHTTGYNAAANTWAEKGIACEACHGPGSAHMKAGKDDRAKTIMSPAKLATAAQQVSVCGQCHGQYSIGDKRFAAGFKPGMDLFAMEGFKLDEVKAEQKLQQLNELAGSAHFKEGVTCTSCHASHPEKANAHQLKAPVVELCNGCHKDQTMAAHAPNAKEGDTCATCHMPDGAHTFPK